MRNKQEKCQKFVEMSRKNHYTTRNLIKHLFREKIKKNDDGAKMFFIAEKQQKAILNFYLDSFRLTK